MAKSLIADKSKMFDLFTRILDRSQKARDSELMKYVQEATDFWTLMMLEEHEHDQICIHNMIETQDACQNWLSELLLILEARVNAGATEQVYKIETLEVQLSTLEKQLKNLLEEDSEKSERMAADEDQIEQLKARVAVLEREVEGAALVSARARLLKNICEDYAICEKNQVRCEQHLKGYTPLSKYQDRMLTRDVIRLF